MKNILFKTFIVNICAIVLSSNVAYSQGQANIWYFGGQAGVDFTSGSPVALTNCSPSFAAFEGVGTVCDDNGLLLFYTDGFTVFNKNHLIMANGSGLNSNSSSTQTGLSVKQPGNDSIYYIFHNDLYNVFCSIIDIDANGGLGAVLQKNISVRTNVTEKGTAVAAANGIDSWVVFKDLNNDKWVCFLLSASGLAAVPVLSSSGPSNPSGIGYLKFSPQGDKLASADFYNGYYSIYDFDNATGIVSNGSSSAPIYVYPYGIEFSPDGTKLYGGAENSNDLYQFDVSAGNNIWNTAVLIFETASIEFEALQLGPDGKIYCSLYTATHLGVINYPNLAGVACGYVDNGPSLNGRQCYLGLPGYKTTIFNGAPKPQSGFLASDSVVCQKFCLSYTDASINDPTSWLWTFEGGNPSTSTEQNPSQICYNIPGVYDVTLISTNASGSDTLELDNFMTVSATPAAPTITQVGYTLTSSASSTYQWQLNSIDIPGATNQSYTILESGYYTVVITDAPGCFSYNTVYVLITGIENIFNGNEISISPNPSNGNFTIEFSDENISDDVAIEVMNALGQKIYLWKGNISSANKKEIQLSNLAAGVYFISISSSDFRNTQKLLIDR